MSLEHKDTRVNGKTQHTGVLTRFEKYASPQAASAALRSRNVTASAPKKGQKGKKITKKSNDLFERAHTVYRHGAATFKSGTEFLRHLARAVAPWIGKKAELLAYSKTVSSRPTGWFGEEKKFDQKDIDERVAVCDSNIAVLRSALQQGLGTKAVRYVLVQNQNLTATITTGVVGTTFNLNPSGSTEWSSIQALFDEVKCLGGRYQFNMGAVSSNNPGTTAVTLNNSFLALCYDPTDSSGLSSVISATEYANHRLYPLIMNASGSAPETGSPTQGTFVFRTESGVLSNGTNTMGDQWQPTSAVITIGNMKSYAVCNEVTAKDVVGGVIYFDVELRSRT